METPLTDWEKVCLLFWKNLCIYWNNRRRVMLSILLPPLLCSVLVFLRMSINATVNPVSQYKPVDMQEAWQPLIAELTRRKEVMNRETENEFTYNVFVPQLIVAYSPNTFEAFQNIMDKARKYLYNITILGFDNCDTMRQNMTEEFYLAGVCFSDKIMTMHPTESIHLVDIYPNHLTYSLIFPTQLRFYQDTFIGATWNTDLLFDIISPRESRIGTDDKGGNVGYIREGFISLQNAISLSYIYLISGKTSLPDIQIQRFPFYQHDDDPLIEGVEVLISLSIVIGYLYPVLQLISYIVHEKEMKLTFVMTTAGISPKCHYLAWYVTGLVQLTPASIMIIALIKIHWQNGYAVCSYSSWIALILFMFAFNMATVSFCIMMSALFNRTTQAVAISGLIWVISYMPYPLKMNDENVNVMYRFTLLLLSNTTLGFGFQAILEFELYSIGLKMSGLFDRTTVIHSYSIGIYIIILWSLSVAYIFIGLYFNSRTASLGFIGKIRRIITKNCNWTHRRRSSSIEYTQRIRNKRYLRMTQVHEVEPNYKISVIELVEVTKIIDDEYILKDVSMSMFRDEITVLMSHNGCGKSLLLELILGMKAPTSGVVKMKGIETKFFFEQGINRVGIALSSNILFEELTVIDQLIFFSRIKGVSKNAAIRDVEKYLVAMNLVDYKEKITGKLSNGIRKQLSICCALAGASEVVIIEEPTSGLDEVARKHVWDLFSEEKFGRSILITSNSAQEADTIGDRVGIMSGGELKCYGSTSFLKEIYGSGFRLICVKERNCNEKAITHIMRKYIPRIKPESDLSNELYYKLEEKHIDKFHGMLNELESRKKELHILSFSFSGTALEDIFIRMGAEDPSDGIQTRHKEIMNGLSIYVEEYKRLQFMAKYELIKGFQLFRNHFCAMFYKRLQYKRRNKRIVSTQIIIMMVVIFITIKYRYVSIEKMEVLPPMRYDFSQYTDSITVIEDRSVLNDSFMEDIATNYADKIFWRAYTHHVLELDANTFSNYIIEQQPLIPEYIDNRYQIAATFGDGLIIAWFNNYPLHSAPLSLNHVHNALLGSLIDNNAKITVWLTPLPHVSRGRSFTKNAATGHILALSISICFSFISSTSIIYLVRERSSQFKYMQFISGLKRYTFWLSTFLFDFSHALVIAILILVEFLPFHVHIFTSPKVIVWFSATVIISVFTTFSHNYVLSLLFNDPVTAYMMASITNICGSLFYCAVSDVLTRGFADVLVQSLSHQEQYRIFSQFAFCRALVKIFRLDAINENCEDSSIRSVSIHLEQCKTSPNCCYGDEIWSWGKGIKGEYTNLLVIAIVSWVALITVEKRRGLYRKNIPADNLRSQYEDHVLRHKDVSDGNIRDDITKEMIRVTTVKGVERARKAIICTALAKEYKHVRVLERLHFMVEFGECFGVLGVGGAGKSSLMKILGGEEELTYGRFEINGIMCDHILEIYKRIGYSPQRNAFLEEFTSRELMYMLCVLHGIPANHITPICTSLAKMLGFYSHFDKVINICSSGTQRRLSFAIAILHNPAVILIDDPSSAIDPAGKRQVWLMINTLRSHGKAVLISSLNLRECEKMCDRVTLISNGRLVFIGTPSHIYQTLIKGYLLRVRIRPVAREQLKSNHFSALKISAFVERKFPNSVLKDHCAHQLRFIIPDDVTKMSHIFEVLQRNQFHMNIESFDIVGDSMSILLLETIANQRNPQV